jgi:hypothetical protein
LEKPVTKFVQAGSPRGEGAWWPWRIKKRICYLYFVPIRSCKVTCRDLSGTEHIVEVTAESLYEAIGKALSVMRQDDWVEEIGEGLTEVRVRVSQPAVEHCVRMKDYRRWLDSQGRTPAECALKKRLVEMIRNGGSRP